jgi:hypothetical protein
VAIAGWVLTSLAIAATGYGVVRFPIRG